VPPDNPLHHLGISPLSTFDLEGREIVARLGALVTRLKETGHEALSADAERLSDQFERIVAMFEDRHRAILEELGSSVGRLVVADVLIN
jgi:hypothetical protein